MRYQFLPRADHGGQPGAEDRTMVPAAEPLAGTAGLQWLWELVEHAQQAEPDTAA